MALVVNDRVKETSTTTGTGTFSLAGAVLGFETFVAGIGNTNTTYYTIVNEDGAFEVGIGTVTDAAPDTLSRDTILSSSNGDAAVNFAAGTKDVFCTLPASKAVILDSSGNIVANNGSNLTNLNASNLASGTVPDARFPATLPAADGSALTNLNATNLASGTVDNARLDADLAAIAGLTSAADKGIQFTGSGTAGTFDLTTAGKALLDDADAAAQRTTLGLGSIATLNTVTLTTDTTGDYVASLTAGNLIDLQNNSGEGATPTIDVDLSELTTSTSDADGDFFAVVDSANAQKKLTKANIAISGFNNDSGFIDGSSLNASNLSSGTVPDARFPATLPAISGANLTNLDASDLASGTVPIARIDLNLLTTSTSDGDGDFFVVVDSVGAEKKLTKANINNSGFNNDAGYTTNTGTVTSVSGGDGLTGSVTTSGSLAVGAGTLIDVTADAVNVDLSELATSTSDADGDFFCVVDSANAQKKLTKANINISGFNNDAGYTTNVGDITGVTAGTLLDGGGTSGTVTLNVDLSELTTSTSDADGDFFVVVDSANAQKKLTKANIAISGFNNDSGFTTNTGTVTSVSGGNGLTGTVTTSGSLAVGAGTGIDVAADSVSIDLSELTTSTSDADGDFFAVVDSANAQKKLTKGNINISGFNNDSGFTTNTGTVTSVSGGNGLTGTVTTSGSLAVGAGTLIDVTADAVSVDLSELTTSTSDTDGDFFVVVDSANAQKKLTKGNINISGFNNDAGYTTNTGDITGVTAGSGLTGGGSSGGVTLNVGAGTGIDVAADAISVDVSDFMTNGSNNRIVTATGTDAMNAEANLTYSGTEFACSVGTNLNASIVQLSHTAAANDGVGITLSRTTSDSDLAAIGVLEVDELSMMSREGMNFYTGGESTYSATVLRARIDDNGHFVPGANDTYDLGASGNVWRNLYTGDLHLSNEAKSEGNAVDGTKGNWTIQEGENDLYILNNKSGKKYKFKLEEM